MKAEKQKAVFETQQKSKIDDKNQKDQTEDLNSMVGYDLQHDKKTNATPDNYSEPYSANSFGMSSIPKQKAQSNTNLSILADDDSFSITGACDTILNFDNPMLFDDEKWDQENQAFIGMSKSKECLESCKYV